MNITTIKIDYDDVNRMALKIENSVKPSMSIMFRGKNGNITTGVENRKIYLEPDPKDITKVSIKLNTKLLTPNELEQAVQKIQKYLNSEYFMKKNGILSKSFI